MGNTNPSEKNQAEIAEDHSKNVAHSLLVIQETKEVERELVESQVNQTSGENQADAPPFEQPQENDPGNNNSELENAATEIEGLNFLFEKEKRNHATLLNQLKMHDQWTQMIIQNLQHKIDELKKNRELLLNQLVEKELSYKIDTEELKALLEDPADDINCIICLSPWQSTGAHRVASLPCGHLYGMSCIRRSIRRTGLCPKCRLPVHTCDVRFILPVTT